MKKPVAPDSKGVAKLAVDDAAAFREAPTLRGFFLNQFYDDGASERQPGTLILTARAGQWCATLKEPTQCLMMKLSAPSLSELWVLMELLLAEESAPWESDPYEAARKSRYKKRS